MAHEKTRLDQAAAALQALDQPGSPSDRISTAMELLSGFMLTGASDEVRSAMESFGLRYNAVLQGYPQAAAQTHPELSDQDARGLMFYLRQACEFTRASETQRILARLRHHGGVLPEAEVTEARRHRDWFVPHLLRECRDQIEKFKKLGDSDQQLPADQHSSVPFFSLYLFSEWQVVDSIPVVLEALKLPGEGPFELFGDAVHEQVPCYLAQFFPDDLDQVDALVRDARANLYVRWAAAGSYKYLVRDRRISTTAAVVRLDRLFHETKIVGDDGRPGPGHDYELSAGILDVVCSIGGSSLSTIAADESNWDFIDETIIHPEDVAGAMTDLHRLAPTRGEDCLASIRGWATFTVEDEPEPLAAPWPRPRPRSQPVTTVPSAENWPPPVQKPIQRTQRVGRNEKCPCGSGKKYKQCCMRSET